MKKIILIFLLSITILIFAEEKITEKKIRVKNKQQNKIIERIPYSGISSIATNPGELQDGYYNISLGFAQIKNFKLALRYVKKIKKQRDKDDCYLKIVIEMIASGLDGKALKTVKKIKEDYYIQQAYSKIISNVIKNTHNYKKAIQYTVKYQDKKDIELTKSWIIEDMLKINKIEDALEFYKMNIPSNNEKNSIFNTVASSYLFRNDYEGLIDFMKIADIPLNDEYIRVIVMNASRLKKTHLIIDIISLLNNQEKDREYARIAINSIRNHNYSEAHKIMLKIQDVENKDRIYLQFAQNYVKDRNINIALSYADSISTFIIKDKLYSICSRSYLKMWKMDEAILLLPKVNNINVKEKIASNITLNLFRNDEMEKYNEVIKTISDVKILDKLYNQIIQRLLSRNQYAQLDEYIEKISTNNIKDNASYEIAVKYLQSNDFKKALEWAERIVNENTRNRIKNMIKEKE